MIRLKMIAIAIALALCLPAPQAQAASNRTNKALIGAAIVGAVIASSASRGRSDNRYHSDTQYYRSNGYDGYDGSQRYRQSYNTNYYGDYDRAYASPYRSRVSRDRYGNYTYNGGPVVNGTYYRYNDY